MISFEYHVEHPSLTGGYDSLTAGPRAGSRRASEPAQGAGQGLKISGPLSRRLETAERRQRDNN